MVFPDYRQRSMLLLLIALIFGAATGALLGDLLSLTLPDGVVKQFFLQSVSWGFSPVTIDLLVTTITVGLRFKFSISSVLGLMAVYYFFRYFR